MSAARELDPTLTLSPRERGAWASSAAAWLVVAGLVLVPLACSPDLMYRFRIKEFVMRGEAILGAFLVLCSVAFDGRSRLRVMWGNRPVVLIALAGFAWAVVTTVTSTHRLLSLVSLVTIGAAIALFFVVWYAAPRVPLLAIDCLVPVAALTSVLATLQEYSIFNPFRVHELVSPHLSATATIGNPNVVGTYLALLAVIFAGAVTVANGWRRAWYVFGGVAAIAGVLVSQTETAVFGVGIGFAVIALRWSWKRALLMFAGLVVIFAIAAALRVPVVHELATLPQRLHKEGLEVALSGRVAPAIIAMRMTAERPLTGFGPGTYGFHFMGRRIALAEERPGRNPGLGTNFGEVHNDHLEIAAEGGVPAYLLFLGFVGLVVVVVYKGRGADQRSRVSRATALPLACSLLLMALAQFPLQVPVTTHLLMTMSALFLGWSQE